MKYIKHMNDSHFHSTMVRLKQGGALKNEKRSKEVFPFHHGAIETLLEFGGQVENVIFPFHYGAIETLNEASVVKEQTKFPFHYGAIETKMDLGQVSKQASISIPLWCD